MSDNLKQLAEQVDSAIAALDAATAAYTEACYEANRDHAARGKPHPVYERARDHVRGAVASRVKLAKHLDLQPVNPPVTTAQHHP